MDLCESGSDGVMKQESGHSTSSPLTHHHHHHQQQQQQHAGSSSQLRESSVDVDDLGFQLIGGHGRTFDTDMVDELCGGGGDRDHENNGGGESVMFHQAVSDMTARDCAETAVRLVMTGEGGHVPAAGTPKPPAGQCKVCGDEATGMYFGALVCVPCKVNISICCVYTERSRPGLE
jgi:hypothetical protein